MVKISPSSQYIGTSWSKMINGIKNTLYKLGEEIGISADIHIVWYLKHSDIQSIEIIDEGKRPPWVEIMKSPGRKFQNWELYIYSSSDLENFPAIAIVAFTNNLKWFYGHSVSDKLQECWSCLYDWRSEIEFPYDTSYITPSNPVCSSKWCL